MWKSIFWFEIRYHLRQPLFYLVALFLSIFVFLWGTEDGSGGAVGKIHLNAPLVTIQVLSAGFLFALFLMVAFVASAALRDFDRRTSALFLSKPVSHFDYLTGRFAGTLALSMLLYVTAAVTLAVSRLMPWLDPQRLGPFELAPYIFALGVLVLPTLFALGATFYALASWSRSMLVTSVGVVGFFALHAAAQILTSDLDSRSMAQLLDPFGREALSGAVRYWTVAEINTALPELSGMLLYNRLLWVAVGVLALGSCVLTFDPSRSKRRRSPPAPPRTTAPQLDDHHRRVRPVFGRATVVRQLLAQTRLEVRTVCYNLPFLGIVAFGLFIVLQAASSAEPWVGTTPYPRTHLMLQALEGGYAKLLLLIAVLYSGELIWKERSLELDEIYDCAPTPNGVYLGAKLTALVVVIVALLALGVAATIGVQLTHGYYDLQLGLYARGVVLIACYPLLMCVLTLFFQVFARSRFVGYGLVLTFILSWDLLEEFGLEHHLYRYASLPPTPYSDLNGYGHYVEPFVWYALYWGLFAVVLLGLSSMLWTRGSSTPWRARTAQARLRFRGSTRAAVVLGAMGWFATGSWIFYNTTVLNEYLPSDEIEARQVAYEKTYHRYKGIALPRIQAVRADVDIFPQQRRVEIRGVYQLKNEGTESITELHVNLPSQVLVNRLDLPAHRVRVEDRRLGYSIYELTEPLVPGARMEFGFDLTVEHPGFVNHGSDTTIVANGTFFNNRALFPSLGYADRKQLEDRNARRAHGLPPQAPAAQIDDTVALGDTPRGIDADWIEFETTVSTSLDQIAIAPGTLTNTWIDGDRRYFHYAMDVPMSNYFAYLSARYERQRDQIDGVEIEVYYHPEHGANVGRMIDAVKKSLRYFTASFGPYQHRHLRIVEFPRYRTFAQSFPNTIPFSESLGFITRLDDEDSFDLVFHVTAHEVAHQWWGHQVIGGDVQGVAMLSETLAQYSAMMVVKHEYGVDKVRHFLEYELEKYLVNRSKEQGRETPLALVEGQDYVYYRKGSVVMAQLEQAMGEAPLNRALANFVAKVRFQPPPFTTTVELLDEIRAQAPAGIDRLIEDLFETITLMDCKAVEATYAAQPDGVYRVNLVVEVRKLRADGDGVETQIPVDDWIDIAVFGEQERGGEIEQTVLFMEQRRISQERLELEVVVDDRPVRAAVDPYRRLIDRRGEDNTVSVVAMEATAGE